MSLALSSEKQTNFPSISFNQQELEIKLSSSDCHETLTGYWQVHFDENRGLDNQNLDRWYLFFCRGRVVFSCFQPISWLAVLETLKFYIPSLRMSAAEKTIEEIQQKLKDENHYSMLGLLSELTLKAKLTSYQEVIEAIKLKILIDIDKYLFDYSGNAEFIADEKLKDDRPIIGFEFDDLVFAAKKRRAQWQEISSLVPSMDSIVYGNGRQIERQNLTAPQKQRLKQLIRSGKTIQQISYDLGEDCLKVAQTFAKLVQKGLVTFDADNLSSIASPAAAPETAAPAAAPQPQAAPETAAPAAAPQPQAAPETAAPAAAPQPQAAPETAAPAPETSKSALTEVFIVDDSMIMLKNFKALVTELGYSVNCCSDGIKAVESMLACNPAVIFLDINMPGISGFQLMKQIRSQPKLASIPLIVMTAEKSLLNQQRAKWSKSKFLSKPLSIDEIYRFKSELAAVLQELAPIVSNPVE